jgi:hypothetical protein
MVTSCVGAGEGGGLLQFCERLFSNYFGSRLYSKSRPWVFFAAPHNNAMRPTRISLLLIDNLTVSQLIARS